MSYMMQKYFTFLLVMPDTHHLISCLLHELCISCSEADWLENMKVLLLT